jgi:hypothetical protein
MTVGSILAVWVAFAVGTTVCRIDSVVALDDEPNGLSEDASWAFAVSIILTFNRNLHCATPRQGHAYNKSQNPPS